MRLFFGIICCFICTVFGIVLSEKYAKRCKFFKDFSCFNKRLISEVSFGQKRLSEIIEDFSPEGDFKTSISKFSSDVVLPEYLKADEKALFADYVNGVGKKDKETQLKELNELNVKLSGLSDLSEIELKKYRPLYIKLGFLTGIAILIMVI